MHTKSWARLRVDVDCGLRRGGWYEALSAGEEELTLAVHGRPKVFPRNIFEVSTAGPSRWTIVSQAGNQSQIPQRWRDGYAVCPSCNWRQLLFGKPNRMLCEGCYQEFEVNWDELYLNAG